MAKGQKMHGNLGSTGSAHPVAGGEGHGGTHAYSFTFSTGNQSVLTMSKTIASGAARSVDITNSTFSTTIGVNALGTTAVTAVTQTRTATNAVDTSIYKDDDGDSSYTSNFNIHVVTATTPAHTHQFTFNTDGSVASDSVYCRNQWKADTIDTNEVYTKTTFNGEAVVVKTTSDTNGYHFEIFRDDNADGTWTEIACGNSTGDNIDTTTGTVTLTGIQTYLAAADAVVG